MFLCASSRLCRTTDSAGRSPFGLCAADRFAGVVLAVTAGWARPQSMVLPSLLCSGNFNEILSCRCSRGLGDEETRDVGRRPQ